MDDLDLALRMLRIAQEEFPLAYDPRYHLGMTLVEMEQPEEAMEHLQWCYEQDPSNSFVPKLIVRARKLMLQDETVTQL